ncbi:MAG: sorbosone dehydrogenase family protein [Phycisphaerales bacterium]|nr:sorbosone dehydrogenase family protein [Phycisphaerales bacterium]
MRRWGLNKVQIARAAAACALSAGLVACERGAPSSSTASTSAPVAPPALASEIATAPLRVATYRISVESLPAPYASASKAKPPRVIDPPADATLRVPPGFRVQLFAETPGARWLANTPDGDVLVTSKSGSTITRLRDTNGDGVADERSVFADPSNGMNLPFGIVFVDGLCFVANTDAVLRFRWEPGQERLIGRGSAIVQLPGQGYNQHWTRNLAVAPDGEHLFVSVGSMSNVSEESPPRACVLRVNLFGTEREVYAFGLRNPVGLAVHPATGALFTAVNERDLLGDDLVPDYFTEVEQGAFYGWPYAYLAPTLLDPRMMREGVSIRPDLAATTRTPDVLFESHSAALGATFHSASDWPKHYRTGAFVAFHGSWNRSSGTGYKLVYLPFDEAGKPTGAYEDFVTGFLTDPSGPRAWGRPVCVLSRPDGSLLFSDDGHGRVYRITFDPALAAQMAGE